MTVDEQQVARQCTTIVATVPPRQLMDVAFVDVPSLESLDLYSDVLTMETCSECADEWDASHRLLFPLSALLHLLA